MPLPIRAQAEKALYRTQQRLRAASPRACWRNARYLRTLPPQAVALPPNSMLLDVAGSLDVRWFLEGGRLAFDSMRETLETRGQAIEDLDTVLDFGCGCGRVLRHWPLDDSRALHGTDYNPVLIRWCQQHLPFATLQTNNVEPPLPYRDDTFAFIYALSVFTHLPEPLQLRWLAELTRILRPGGYLLLTVHGAAYLLQLEPAEQRRFLSGELIVRHETVPGANYCSAFHPDEYIATHFTRDLRLLTHAQQAATGNPFQDIILLQKPA